jgi:hypothetical protein
VKHRKSLMGWWCSQSIKGVWDYASYAVWTCRSIPFVNLSTSYLYLICVRSSCQSLSLVSKFSTIGLHPFSQSIVQSLCDNLYWSQFVIETKHHRMLFT